MSAHLAQRDRTCSLPGCPRIVVIGSADCSNGRRGRLQGRYRRAPIEAESSPGNLLETMGCAAAIWQVRFVTKPVGR